MVRRDSEAPMRARIPADVEKKDAILFGFTFRQVVILTVAGLIIYAAWTALARVVHPLVFLVAAIPVAGFARWLNSLDAPVQILVRAARVDLTTLADRIAALAPSLPHPALEAAALSHVAFLDDLAAQRELLHRQVTIAVRDRRGPGHTLHRAAEAVRALAACEVDAAVLDGYDAAGAVAASLSPTGTAGAGASTVNRSD